MTRLSVLVLLMLAGMVAAPTAQAATPLYPDLSTLPPRDLRFDRTDVSMAGSGVIHNVLRFSNTVLNTGEGRLMMRGQVDPATRNAPAIQRVFDDAGGYVDYPVGTFVYHLQHDHYHFDDWGNYQLWTKADYDKWLSSGRSQGQAKKVGSKTTSCVMDEEFVRSLPETPWPAVFPSTGCGPNSKNLLQQGLSVGWGDTYDYYRFEQWIDLDQETLADGEYVLRSVTDPLNKIYESPDKATTSRESQADNEAITRFSVANGALVDSNAPSGTVTINHVDPSTTSPSVTVQAIGRDDVSGVGTVRLSNDGVTWASYTYTGGGSTPMQLGWNLNDAGYGGTSADGIKTVYAQWKDRTGKWSPTATDTIALNGTSPPPPSDSGYAQAVLADGPSGYWRLGESSGTQAADAAGTSAGTYRNGVLLGQTSLVRTDANAAARFDGVNDHVAIPFSSAVDASTALSMEAWIKPNALPAAGQFATIATKPESFSMQFYGNQLEFTVIQAGARKRLRANAGTIVAGQTYHVVGTYDGNQQKLYINGKLAPSRAQTGNITQNSNGFYIGSWDGTKEFFNGWIDDLAIYKTPLTAQRADAHYTAGNTG